MKREERFWWLVATLFLLTGLGKQVAAERWEREIEVKEREVRFAESFISTWRGVANDLILEPKWYLSTQVRMKKNSLIRVGKMESGFSTDPLVPTYETTLRVGDVAKLNFEITHELTPYTESQTSYRSLGSERLLLRGSYPIKPDCLSINIETGWDKYKYGPGIDIYDPFLAAGAVGGGFTENRTENTERFGAGFSLTLPSSRKKILGLQASIGGQQMSYLYPLSEKPSEREEKDLVNKMSVYGNLRADLILSPKFKIACNGNIAPDQRIGYYTTGGYAEMYYTRRTISISTEYELNPVLKFGCGFSFRGNISGQTLGKGAEEFGIPLEERRTGSDEFYVKVDFHP